MYVENGLYSIESMTILLNPTHIGVAIFSIRNNRSLKNKNKRKWPYACKRPPALLIENNLSIDFKECQLDSNIFIVDRLFVIQMFCPDARGNSTMHTYTFPYQNVYSKLIYSKCISRNDFWLMYNLLYIQYSCCARINSFFFARMNRHSIVYRL